jgi:hypothetical protein
MFPLVRLKVQAQMRHNPTFNRWAVGGIVTVFRKQRVMSLKKAHFPPRGWSARVESSDRTFGKGMVPILTLSKPMVPTGLTAVITFREQPAKITGFCANLCFDLLQTYALRHTFSRSGLLASGNNDQV